jgi:hypothetical protein
MNTDLPLEVSIAAEEEMKKKPTRFAVLGGGVAGLATAYQLQRILQPGNTSMYKKNGETPPTIDVFEKGSRESYRVNATPESNFKRASLGASPARTIRMSGGEANVRETFAMVQDLQKFLDHPPADAKPETLAALEAFKGRKLFKPEANVLIGKPGKIDPETRGPSEEMRAAMADKQAPYDKAGIASEIITGEQLKARYRQEVMVDGQPVLRSIYETVPDNAAVLIEKPYDPISNPNGVSGTMDYEAVLNVLIAKLEHEGVKLHFNVAVTSYRDSESHDERGFSGKKDVGVTLKIQQEGKDNLPSEQSITFDKLVIAPGEAIEKVVDTTSRNIQVARDRVVLMHIDLEKLGIAGPGSIPFTKGACPSGSEGAFYSSDMTGKVIKFMPNVTLKTLTGNSPETDAQLHAPVNAAEVEKASQAAYDRLGLAQMNIPMDALKAASTFSSCVYTRPRHEELVLITPLSENVVLCGLDSSGTARTIGGLGKIAAHQALEMPEPYKGAYEKYGIEAHHKHNTKGEEKAPGVDAEAIARTPAPHVGLGVRGQ